MKRIAIIIVLFFLTGCTTSMYVDLVKEPGKCQVSAASPNALATVGFAVCWDEDGKAIGMAGGTGTSQADVVLGVIQAGSTIGAAVVLGKGAVKALEAQQRIEIREAD